MCWEWKKMESEGGQAQTTVPCRPQQGVWILFRACLWTYTGWGPAHYSCSLELQTLPPSSRKPLGTENSTFLRKLEQCETVWNSTDDFWNQGCLWLGRAEMASPGPES